MCGMCCTLLLAWTSIIQGKFCGIDSHAEFYQFLQVPLQVSEERQIYSITAPSGHCMASPGRFTPKFTINFRLNHYYQALTGLT